MINTTSRVLLTLVAGGGLCGAAYGQLPAGIDPSRIPSGVDLSRLPAGVNIPQLPAGGSFPQLPSGGSFPQIPAGMNIPQLPGGIDPSQFPGGLSIPPGGGGIIPGGTSTLPPAQGVAIQGGGGGLGSGPTVTGSGNVPRPRNRPEFDVGINVQQTGELQLSGTGDDVTYTEVSGNIGGQIKNRRIVASGRYRASYRIPEIGDIGKSLNQDGVMRADAIIIEELLTMEAGALITRSRVDANGAAPQSNSASAKNLTQTYSSFIEPSLTRHFGDLALNASYRLAYTKNDGSAPSPLGGPPINRFDDSINHTATATVGMENSELPFDWTASVEHARENTDNLAKHTRSLNARGEIILPFGRTLALVASGGYERTKISELPPLIVNGATVIDESGRFVADPTAARVVVYDLAGIVGDAGVIWSPSSRTRLELRAGYRYDDLTITGEFQAKLGARSGLTVILYDRIETFAQSVSGGLAGSPAELDLNNSSDPDASFQNCLLGKDPGTGRCLGGALGQASANNYREQSVNVIFSHQMRRWTFSASGGYSKRTYIDLAGTVSTQSGVVDRTLFGALQMNGTLSRQSGISFSFRGNLFKNGQVGVGDATSGEFRTAYYRSLGRGIRLQADLTVEASKQDGMTADVLGRAQVGLQYDF